jgi:5-methylcytosine-specific restriction endonuclease McrA
MSEQLRSMRAYVWEHYRGHCCYCTRRLRRSEATVDHYVPQALGGNNARSNLRLACWKCNNEKADTPPHLWVPRVAPQPPTRQEVRNQLLARCAARQRGATT